MMMMVSSVDASEVSYWSSSSRRKSFSSRRKSGHDGSSPPKEAMQHGSEGGDDEESFAKQFFRMLNYQETVGTYVTPYVTPYAPVWLQAYLPQQQKQQQQQKSQQQQNYEIAAQCGVAVLFILLSCFFLAPYTFRHSGSKSSSSNRKGKRKKKCKMNNNNNQEATATGMSSSLTATTSSSSTETAEAAAAARRRFLRRRRSTSCLHSFLPFLNSHETLENHTADHQNIENDNNNNNNNDKSENNNNEEEESEETSSSFLRWTFSQGGLDQQTNDDLLETDEERFEQEVWPMMMLDGNCSYRRLVLPPSCGKVADVAAVAAAAKQLIQQQLQEQQQQHHNRQLSFQAQGSDLSNATQTHSNIIMLTNATTSSTLTSTAAADPPPAQPVDDNPAVRLQIYLFHVWHLMKRFIRLDIAGGVWMLLLWIQGIRTVRLQNRGPKPKLHSLRDSSRGGTATTTTIGDDFDDETVASTATQQQQQQNAKHSSTAAAEAQQQQDEQSAMIRCDSGLSNATMHTALPDPQQLQQKPTQKRQQQHKQEQPDKQQQSQDAIQQQQQHDDSYNDGITSETDYQPAKYHQHGKDLESVISEVDEEDDNGDIDSILSFSSRQSSQCGGENTTGVATVSSPCFSHSSIHTRGPLHLKQTNIIGARATTPVTAEEAAAAVAAAAGLLDDSNSSSPLSFEKKEQWPLHQHQQHNYNDDPIHHHHESKDSHDSRAESPQKFTSKPPPNPSPPRNTSMNSLSSVSSWLSLHYESSSNNNNNNSNSASTSAGSPPATNTATTSLHSSSQVQQQPLRKSRDALDTYRKLPGSNHHQQQQHNNSNNNNNLLIPEYIISNNNNNNGVVKQRNNKPPRAGAGGKGGKDDIFSKASSSSTATTVAAGEYSSTTYAGSTATSLSSIESALPTTTTTTVNTKKNNNKNTDKNDSLSTALSNNSTNPCSPSNVTASLLSQQQQEEEQQQRTSSEAIYSCSQQVSPLAFKHGDGPNFSINQSNSYEMRNNSADNVLLSSDRQFNMSLTSEPNTYFFETANTTDKLKELSIQIPVPDKNGYVVGDEFLEDGSQATPLLVFVNSRSGPQQGHLLVTQLRRLLNPIQVWDLANGAPDVILESFLVFTRLRILVCGGDGTVSWIISALEKMNLKRKWPPIAILPLGTGNDLARIHGWGGGYNNESLITILEQISESYISLLDRWEVTIDDKKAKKKDFKTFFNYLGVGADAQAALQVHYLRESKPQWFFSRMVNKLWYGVFGAEDMIKASSVNVRREIKLVADGVEVPLPSDSQGIIILNIDSYAGGVPLWSHATKPDHWMSLPFGRFPRRSHSMDEFRQRRNSFDRIDSCDDLQFLTGEDLFERVTACDRPSSCQDGLLEVVSIRGAFHLGQIKVGLSNAQRLCQAKEIVVSIKNKVAVQLDGEPWRQSPCKLRITRKKGPSAVMLHRSADDGGVETEMSKLLDWAEERHLIDGEVHSMLMKEFSRRIESKTRRRRVREKDGVMLKNLKKVISHGAISNMHHSGSWNGGIAF